MSKQTDGKFGPIFAKTPPVFAIRRAANITNGLFYNSLKGVWEGNPVTVRRIGIRGTQGTHNATAVANIQQTDSARLSEQADALVVNFRMRLGDLSKTLHSCSAETPELTKAVRQSVRAFVERAKTSNGLREVANRVARRVAGGTWLWSNLDYSQSVKVVVQLNDAAKTQLEFDTDNIPSNNFDNYSKDELALGEVFFKGLNGDRNASINVVATVDFGVGGGVEVFPSQCYIEHKPAGYAKPLYYVDLPDDVPQEKDPLKYKTLGHAALRDQKIGNKLRSIDTWYPEFAAEQKAIPVEPTGAHLDDMVFYRNEKKVSAFSLLASLNDIDPNTADGMFVIALMMRGGVFGSSAKD